MNYKHPPIYKYGLLIIIIFMFFKHEKIISQDKILLYSIAITLFVAMLDFILINEHPYPLDSENKEKEETFTDDDIDEIINSCDDESEIDDMYNPHVAVTPKMMNNRDKRMYYSSDDLL